MGSRKGLVRLDALDETDIFKRIFWSRKADGESTAKGKYVWMDVNGKWHVKGMELIRSDGCKYMRELQRAIIGYVMESEFPVADGAEKIIRQWCDRLHLGMFATSDLIITESVGKSLDSYKVDLPQVRVAKQMLADGKELYQGMKVPYVVVGRVKGKDKVKAVHYDSFDGRFDVHLYWVKKIYGPTWRVLDAVFPDSGKLWKSLKGYNPSADQGSLFESAGDKMVVEKAVLEFRVGDEEKFDEVREVLLGRPGVTSVGMLLGVPGEDVLMKTGICVEWSTELVRTIEQIVGHVVYTGVGGEWWQS